MAAYNEKSEELTFRERVINFLTTYKNAIIAVGVIILVVLASMTIYTTVKNNQIEKSTLRAEELQSSFDEWKSAEEGEKSELEENIRASGEKIISDYSGFHAAARSHMILGRLDVEKEEWVSAEEHFLSVADSYPENYLAPAALMSAAVCREEQGDFEGAVNLYREVEEEYADSSPAAPHALFSIGRLSEKLEETEAALEAYNSIVDDFSSSNWTKLARSRIIYLETN